MDIPNATIPSSAEQHAAMAWALLGPNHRGNITFEAIQPDEGNDEGGDEEAEGGEKAGSGEGGRTSPKAQQVAPLPSPRPLSNSLGSVLIHLPALALPPRPPPPPPPPLPLLLPTLMNVALCCVHLLSQLDLLGCLCVQQWSSIARSCSPSPPLPPFSCPPIPLQPITN